MTDKPDHLTAQQSRAATTRGVSVVLSSGAGCGKTQVLTERYLSHLREDAAEIGELVAITFTDRAAREMRRRIRKALNAELAATRIPAERDRWSRHLRNLETAAISTIHSFCAMLLRQHAIAAGIDPRFEVLEDVLSSNLREEALRDGLQGLLTSETPTGDDLRHLVTLFGWQATADAVEHLLSAPDVAAWETWAARDPSTVADEWLCGARSELLTAYVAHLLVGAPKIADCLRLLKTTPCLGPKMRANVQTLLTEMPRLAEATELAATVEMLCEAAKVGSERARAWPDAATYESVRDALAEFREDLPKKLAAFLDAPEDPGEAAAVGQRFARVAAACARVYQERKRQAGVVDFHDLLTLARDLLRDRADVREQTCRRGRFILIDELQDTDPVQMDLVRLMCGEELGAGKLFTVGDAKQSIYRFRGADVGLFQDLRRSMAVDGQQQLSVNFRSQPRVLSFVNALFAAHMPDYEPLTGHRPQANTGPCTEFLWTARGLKENAADGRRREADRIARRIASIIGRGERLVVDKSSDALRPVRAGDVVLLFRSMSNVGTYEAALRARGLDYYLIGGRAFFAQQEVYDVVNLLRAVENPHDAVCLAGTLRSPFGCLSDETLYVLAGHEDGLWAGLHDPSTLDRLPDEKRRAAERVGRYLDRWRTQKDRLPIAALLNLVLADSGYDAALQFEFLGERKLANLWKLIELARTFDRSGLFGLADFIARLGDLVRSQPREEQAATLPESADVVRLMTIHQAKGLEFPVVVLPDLAATTGGSHLPAAFWDPDFGCVARPPAEDGPPLFSEFGWKLWRAGEAVADWHEDLRTFYVACTRAEDYLILSAGLPESRAAANTAMAVLTARFDLDSGACLDDNVPPADRPPILVVGPDDGVNAGAHGARLPCSPPPLTTADADAVAPVAVRRLATCVLSLPALEAALQTGSTAPCTNDESIDLTNDPPTGPRGRAVKSVLRAWDFADHDGWQQPLGDALAAEPAESDQVGLRDFLAAGLAMFAESDLRNRLAAATEVWRDVEFLLAVSESGDDGPVVRGQIDLLWREGDGGWRVFGCEAAPPAGDPWCRRRSGLLAAALAVRRQTGSWPVTVGLIRLATGGVVTITPNDRLVAAALQQLMAVAGEVSTG